MSRDIAVAVEPELSAEHYRIIVLAELDFPTAPVYVHSGVGDIIFNSHTFKGVGQLGKIGELQETTDLQTYGFSLELSGIDNALVSIAVSDDIQGRAAALYIAFLDDQHQLITDPVGPWTGRMDTLSGQIGKTSTLRLDIESRLADWERPRIRRYTDADQQAVYPGDKGFEFVSQLQEKEIQWGPQ